MNPNYDPPTLNYKPSTRYKTLEKAYLLRANGEIVERPQVDDQPTASKRRGKSLKGFQDLNLKAKATIWP